MGSRTHKGGGDTASASVTETQIIYRAIVGCHVRFMGLSVPPSTTGGRTSTGTGTGSTPNVGRATVDRKQQQRAELQAHLASTSIADTLPSVLSLALSWLLMLALLLGLLPVASSSLCEDVEVENEDDEEGVAVAPPPVRASPPSSPSLLRLLSPLLSLLLVVVSLLRRFASIASAWTSGGGERGTRSAWRYRLVWVEEDEVVLALADVDGSMVECCVGRPSLECHMCRRPRLCRSPLLSCARAGKAKAGAGRAGASRRLRQRRPSGRGEDQQEDLDG